MLPCLLLALWGPLEALLSVRRYWFTQEALEVHLRLVSLAVDGGALLAVLLALWPPARERASAHLEALGRLSPRRHAAWVGTAALGVFGLFLFLKACQYRGFQLPADSAATANVVFNVGHGRGFACSVFGVDSHFAVHFIPFFALLAPLLLVWSSLLPLLAFQSLLVASVPLAGYVLVWRRTASSSAAFAAFWLLFTSSYLFHMAAASVYPGLYLSPFFLWAAVLAELGLWLPAAAALVLMLLSIEQACLALFGAGLYLLPRLGWRNRRAWLMAGGICASAVLLFLLEAGLKGSDPASARFRSWEMFSHLKGGPLDILSTVFWPPSKLKPMWSMFESTGFLPLLSPWSLIPWAVNFAPSLLASPGDVYHTIRLQYAGYFIGPLWWAALLGLIRAQAWLAARKRAAWLVVLALGLGALNLYRGPNVLLRDWMRAYFSEIPELAAMVPRDAAVWAQEYAAAALSARSLIKAMPQSLDPAFLGGLFAPDFVLMDRDWPAKADAESRGRILTFLSREGYAVRAERPRLVLLERPRSARASPGLLSLPKGDPAEEEAFLRVLSSRDHSAALEFYLRQAARGDEEAMFNLGVSYHQGLGAGKDLAQAREWWLKAAALGVADAANNLGMLAGDAGDWAEALTWFTKAAETGSADAQFNVGLAHAMGRGTAEDWTEAVSWFRKAAEGGNGSAQFNLGLCLAEGLGTAKDPDGARRWLGKAAAAGHKQAARRLAALEGR